jgi:hypothetical protein
MQKILQKKIIVLKTETSRNFEEVHLILREESGADADANSLAEEANRILQKAEQRRLGGKSLREPSDLRIRLGWFFIGVFTALGIVSLVALLLSSLF